MKKHIKILLICLCVFVLSFLLTSCLSSRSKLVRAIKKFNRMENYHIVGTIEMHNKDINTIKYNEVDIKVKNKNKIIKSDFLDEDETLLYSSSFYKINLQRYLSLSVYDKYIDINDNYNKHRFNLFDVSLFDIDVETSEMDIRSISIRQNNEDIIVRAYEIALDEFIFNKLLRNNFYLDYRFERVLDEEYSKYIINSKKDVKTNKGKFLVFVDGKNNIARIVLDIDYYNGDSHYIDHIVYDVLENKKFDFEYPDINESNTITLEDYIDSEK